MNYNQTVTLRDGGTCILRNAAEQDGQASLDFFILTHRQTDYLLSYPDEITFTVEEQREYLRKKAESDDAIEILALIGDKVIGTAGFERIDTKDKLKHRATFGISVDRDHWGFGVGRALTQACIQCAKTAGFSQLELEAVADNERAIKLYTRAGFVEYGRNPRGFRSRLTGWQTLVLMRLELDRRECTQEVNPNEST